MKVGYCFALVAITCNLMANMAGANELRVGTAVVDITPAVGTPMLTPQSRPSVKLAEPAHDPLCVRAVVMAVGNAKVAIAACDLTSIPNAIFDDARRRIVSATALNPDAIMISATHTHTAPQIRARFLGRVDDDARKKSLDYIDSLPAKIAQAVIQANSKLETCTVSAGFGFEPTISFNRRFVMRDGSVMTNPGKAAPELHAQIVRPAGPTDPQVGVVTFDGIDNRPLATLVNFSLHLDTDGGAAPTADFAGTLHARLAQARGSQMLSLFAIGAAGNINHYDLLDPNHPRRAKGHDESARIGNKLADAVIAAYPQLHKLAATELVYARQAVEIDLPREKGLALAAQHNNAAQFFDGELDIYNIDGRQWFEAEVQVIALGPELAWVGLPGEMFVEFGLMLKLASPFRYTMIHELANRSIGYVPNMRAYPEGAYEVQASRCSAGSGEKLVDVATRLLVDVKHAQALEQ